MSPRERRRVANARVLAVEQGDAELLVFACECGDADCTTRVPLSMRHYRRLTLGQGRYLVATAHWSREDERVLYAHDAYMVVEPRAASPGSTASTIRAPSVESSAPPLSSRR